MKRWRYLDTVVFFAALGVTWEYGVRAFGIKAYLLPTLSDILRAAWEARGHLWTQSMITTHEVAIGFVAALIGGALIAVGIYFAPVAQRTLYPLVTGLQAMPKVALAPVIVVWFGYGLASKVVMTFLFAFFPIVISTLGGLYSTPRHLEEHFRALRASGWTTFWRLRVPSALPNFIDGCKVAMPVAMIGAVVGEFVGSSEGLGNLIMLATSAGRTDLVFAGIIAVTVLAMVLFWFVH
ncbi:MAG: ABC transporter permease, partial [Candidatus Rokubacteria bacterium]|nr:ABC transporter permease [Candidatus Rokubacteria bacterium]